MAKMSKQMKDLLEVLEAMSENANAISHEFHDDGDEETADNYFRQYMTYEEVIWCIKNPSYFRRMQEIFLDREEEVS